MPVDLAKDTRRLSELVQGVPGLGEVCALALGIIKAAQVRLLCSLSLVRGL